jgi:HrpA-like RNA helicase
MSSNSYKLLYIADDDEDLQPMSTHESKEVKTKHVTSKFVSKPKSVPMTKQVSPKFVTETKSVPKTKQVTPKPVPETDETKSTSHVPEHLLTLKIMPMLLAIFVSIDENPVTTVSAGTGSGKSAGIMHFYMASVTKTRKMMISIPTIFCARLAYQYARKMIPTCTDVGLSAGGTRINFGAKTVVATTQTVNNYLCKLFRTNKSKLDKMIVMIDEAHHTNVENYILHGLCNWFLQQGAKLKVIIASATLGVHNFTELNKTTVFTVEGTQYPVTYHWAKKNRGGFGHSAINEEKVHDQVIANIVHALTEHKDGNILVFVQGQGDCFAVVDDLKDEFPEFDFVPCYAGMSEQAAESITGVSTKRKVIISTNVAECGVTLPDIIAVVDSGLQKKMKQTFLRKILDTERISRATARQRAGRAGRTQPGHYYPVFTEDGFNELPEHIQNDFDLIEKHIPVLALLANDMPAKEILMIADTEWNNLVTDMRKWKLIDENSKVTDLGREINKYPLSIPSAVALIKMNDLYKTMTPGEESDTLMVYMSLALCLIDVRISMPNLWNIPVEFRKNRRRFVRENCSEFIGDTDLCVMINVLTTMMFDCLDEETGRPKNVKKWCIKNHVNFRFMSQTLRLFDTVFKLVFGDIYLYKKDYQDIQNMSVSGEFRKTVVKCLMNGYTDHVYVLTGESKYKKRGSEEVFSTDNQSLAKAFMQSPSPKKIIALGVTSIRTPKVVLNLLSLCIPLV